MKGLEPIRSSAAFVAETLRRSGFGERAEELERYVSLLESESTRLGGLRSIEGMCHIKILGDLAVRVHSGQNWQAELDKLQSRCRRAARRFERASAGSHRRAP